jgi:hypothetical protein
MGECGARPLHRVSGHERVGIGKSCVCQGICRVLFDGLLEVLERRLETALKSAHPEEPSLQIELIRAGVVRVLPNQLAARELRERDLQTIDHTVGDIVLNREDICHATVVTLGPEMTAVFGAHKLRGDAQPVAGLPYRALEDGIHVE